MYLMQAHVHKAWCHLTIEFYCTRQVEDFMVDESNECQIERGHYDGCDDISDCEVDDPDYEPHSTW